MLKINFAYNAVRSSGIAVLTLACVTGSISTCTPLQKVHGDTSSPPKTSKPSSKGVVGDIEVGLPTKSGMREDFNREVNQRQFGFTEEKPDPLMQKFMEMQLDDFVTEEKFFYSSASHLGHSIPILNKFIAIGPEPDGAKAFAKYVQGISPDLAKLHTKTASDFPKGRYFNPSYIVLHNTAIPSLKDRPNGFKSQHMVDLAAYYGAPDPSRNKTAWNSGPAAFVDDKGIWLFTGFLQKNTHSPCANAFSWGIEQLGDYMHEPYQTGRGSIVRHNAIEVLAILSVANGFSADSLKLHLESTCHKGSTDCPGTNCINDKKHIISDLSARIKYWQAKWRTM